MTGAAMQIALGRFDAASLRFASGACVLEVGRLVLHQLVAHMNLEDGKPRLSRLEAASAELSDVKAHGPLAVGEAPASGAWSLGPLASANGTIRAEVVDAHLLFDADVTVPIREGRIDFKDATVEHVGPDSRMGVSRLGLYVDAPNGRSYLYQFPSAPVAGVEYERRGSLPGRWVSDRGSLQLQPFGEALLRQAVGEQTPGLTQQARLLFDRTKVSGEVRLGDGRFAAPGVQADLVGRAQGRNQVRVHSEAVGRGLTLAVDSLSVREARLDSGTAQLGCDAMTAALTLRVFVEGAQLRLSFEAATVSIQGLRLQL